MKTKRNLTLLLSVSLLLTSSVSVVNAEDNYGLGAEKNNYYEIISIPVDNENLIPMDSTGEIRVNYERYSDESGNEYIEVSAVYSSGKTGWNPEPLTYNHEVSWRKMGGFVPDWNLVKIINGEEVTSDSGWYPIVKSYIEAGNSSRKDSSAVIYGDINSDGRADLTDISGLSLYIIGDITFTDEQMKVADVDEDGEVNLADLAKYRQYLSKVIDSLETVNPDKAAVPTAVPVDKTDYSKIERDPSAVESGFSGAREATEEQIEESKKQPDKVAVPTANPIDNGDYSKVDRDPAAIDGFGGLKEATPEQIEESKKQPDKVAVPTANPIDNGDYSKVDRDPAAIDGFGGLKEATPEQIEESKNQTVKK